MVSLQGLPSIPILAPCYKWLQCSACSQLQFFFSGSNGKLVVVGSGAIFSDQYIDKEDNHKIKEVIFDFLTNSDEGSNSSSEAPSTGIKLNEIDAEDPEISDYNMIPDTCRLANAVRVCLQVRRKRV